MNKPQTLKGFRDFLPVDAIKRQFVIGKIKEVFERFGFDPLETPALEYADTLMGKYGEEADKLLYLFEDNGKRKVGLRYDQTVPLSRVIAQYSQQLPLPFKRYQIQPVWRAENTQKGRYREFLQCDIDTVGTTSPLADAEIIACTIEVYKNLGFRKPQIWINDRTIFDSLGLTKKEIIIIDKMDKIEKVGVISELKNKGRENAEDLFEAIKNAAKTKLLDEICSNLKALGYNEDTDFLFTPFLARGLEYYTSTIFEAKVCDSETQLLSLAGGGRFDKLIGSFSGRDIPAVGIAFGFDRIVEAMEELQILPPNRGATQVLVTVFAEDLLSKSLEITSQLRSKSINAEVYLESAAKLDKQLKYADKKGIPYVVIAGPEEVKQNKVKLKNMKERKEELLTIEELLVKLT